MFDNIGRKSCVWQSAPTVFLLALAGGIGFGSQYPRSANQSGQIADPIAINQAAIASLRAINIAETTYATTYMRGYSSSLSALTGRPSGQPTFLAANLIDNELGAGAKNDYTFTYRTEVSGGRPGTYTVTASPMNGVGNGNFYFTDQTGLIRQHSSRPATVHDPGASLIVRLDPALDDIVPPDATVEVLADLGVTQGSLTEGPVWVRKGGYLLFSDVAADVIDKWTPDGTISEFLKPSGYTGTEPSQSKWTHNGRAFVHLIGSVGITLDPQGRVVFCAQGDRAIVRLENDGKRTILADRYEGKRLNSPNDLVYKSDGALYFTDPASGFQGGDNDPLKELPFDGIFLLKNGTLTLLDKTLKLPNGVVLSPDEKYLYAIDSAKSHILRYKIQPDDTLADGHVFLDVSAYNRTADGTDRGELDGMKVDRNGNIYTSGPDGIWIVSPEGKHLGTIMTPTRICNPAFGGNDGKSLFLTTHTGELYRVHLKSEGIYP